VIGNFLGSADPVVESDADEENAPPATAPKASPAE